MSLLHKAAPFVALLASTYPGSARAAQMPQTLDQLFGPGHSAAAQATAPSAPALPSNTPGARLRYWNTIAVDASGRDHTPPGPGDRWVSGAHPGPGRSSRAMAIVHIAIYDAVNSARGGYESYTGVPRIPNASVDAAIAQAARDTLVALFPSQRYIFDPLWVADLVRMPGTLQAKALGVVAGRRAASAILALRQGDGSNHPEPVLGTGYVPGLAPGIWRQDPISLVPVAMGAHWAQVRPFVIRTAHQFRVAPPPPMTSAQYAAAYQEVQRLGGDGVTTPTERTEDQTEAGIYWAYDGTPSLCAPPRLYNQLATTISRNVTDVSRLARLYALVNVAMADAGLAIWESKYHYKTWRPVAGIRESDPGTGPTGLGDGNPATNGDPNFWPLGAPASNLQGPNFTPPFPAYPSGHAGFGGALFQVLRNFFGTDRIAFTFVSDELNGVTLDNEGNPRPLRPRTFATLSQAEEENGQSRIYLGIHWSFDKTRGIAQGRQVANYVFANAFRPRP